MVPTESEIISRLTLIARRVLGDPGIELTADSTPDDVPGWDSIGQVSLVVAVERAWNIHIDAADAEEIYGVRDLVGLVRNALGAREAA